MYKAFVIAWAVVLAWPSAAIAQEAGLTQLREEMKALQRSYEERMQSLEKRLVEAEARAKTPDQAAPRVQQSAQAPAASVSRDTLSAFNPGISLILQGTFARTSRDPNNFAITGFVPSGGEVGPPRRGFSLAETELTFTGNIDPYFRAVAIAALTPENEVEVEEAYIQTLALPRGFTLKAGRYLSGIGYQNEIHQHAWDFQDAPLPYKAFLGGRYRQDGVQLKWIAPTPFFLQLGAELGSGDSFPGSNSNKNGAGSFALFGHVGGDIGTDYAWRAGLSWLRASSRNRGFEDVDSLGNTVANSFSGRSRVMIVDGILKWAPHGNATQTSVTLQGEYFRTRQAGTLTFDDTGQAAPQFGTAFSDAFRAAQSSTVLHSQTEF